MRGIKRLQILIAGAALLVCACAVQVSVNAWDSQEPPVQAEHALLSGPEAAHDQLDQNAPPPVLMLEEQPALQYSVAKLWLI